MDNSLDQGSILGGLRSNKYPDMKCYGIILTASCDIAHSKVAKLYYVIALDVVEWGYTRDTYLKAYQTSIDQSKKKYYDYTNQLGLSPELLETFEKDVVLEVLENEVQSQSRRKTFVEKYEQYMLLKNGINDVQGIKAVIKNDDAPLRALLKEINEGKLHHYHFLPSIAYKDEKNITGGLLVDFQEINWISFENAQNIINPGIDNLILDEYPDDLQELYKKMFWLEEPEAFVQHFGIIKSPWREHLMQRFSYCFARIGLTDVKETDYSNIIKNMTEET